MKLSEGNVLTNYAIKHKLAQTIVNALNREINGWGLGPLEIQFYERIDEGKSLFLLNDIPMLESEVYTMMREAWIPVSPKYMNFKNEILQIEVHATWHYGQLASLDFDRKAVRHAINKTNIEVFESRIQGSNASVYADDRVSEFLLEKAKAQIGYNKANNYKIWLAASIAVFVIWGLNILLLLIR